MTQIHADSPGHNEPHAVPLRILFAVFVALLFYTFLTVAVTWVDLGSLNLWIALAVAVIKAVMVCLYFMHLRWDSPFNGFIITISFIFVALFIGLALLDSVEYQPDYQKPAIATDTGGG